MSKVAGNIWKLYVGSFVSEVYFFAAVIVPIFGGLGFSMQEIMMMEAIFSVALVIMEIPSGYFADIFGRRLSLILSACLFLMGIIVYAFAETFLVFAIGEVLLAVGISFSSGAKEAMIYDTLIEMGEKERYKKVQGTIVFNANITRTISNVLAGLCILVSLRFPFYISIIPSAIWLPFAFSLVEPKRHEMPFEKWGHFKRILRETWEDKKLRWFLFYAAFPGAFLLMGYWMYQSYMELVELPLVYFGVVVAGLSILSGLGSKYAEEIEEWLSPKMSLILIPVLLAGAWISMSLLNSYWGLAFIMFAGLVWGFSFVSFQDFIQKMASSDRRATVLSIRSMILRTLFFVMSPFVGAIVDLYDVRYALVASALILLLFGGFGLAMLRKVRVI